MRYFTPAVFVLWIGLLLSVVVTARADAPVPAAIAAATSFHGHLAYQAHPAGDLSIVVNGTLDVSADGWAVDERGTNAHVRASNQQSWIRTGSQTLVFDDPFEVDALANAWAVLLGTSSGAQVNVDPSGSSWSTSSGARIYLDADRSEAIGVADIRSAADASFSFSDWIEVGGLRLPQSIVRMRDGVAVASFVIDHYQVDWAPNSGTTAFDDQRASNAAAPALALPPRAANATALAWRPLRALFALLVIALGIVVWARRDALVERLSQRLAADPRGWHDEGTSIFVSAEGVLWFQGRQYRVGSAFFNRQALVQSSPLFIRVSSPHDSRVIILARKFPLPAFSHNSRPSAQVAPRRSAAGFTLVEALAACSLFASVIVAVVFPTLVVLAHADRLAAQHELALQIASNALADEETALAYGYEVKDGSVVSTVDGMKLSETLSAAGIPGLHNLTVDVSDASGHTLAAIATQVGPPVPPPGAPSPAPSYPASR